MADSTSSVDAIISALPANIQEALKALVQQEFAKNAPAPPKELTPDEQAAVYLKQARAALGGENTAFHAGEILMHDRIISLLELLVDTVFAEKPAESASADTSAPSDVVPVETPSTETIGSAV